MDLVRNEEGLVLEEWVARVGKQVGLAGKVVDKRMHKLTIMPGKTPSSCIHIRTTTGQKLHNIRFLTLQCMAQR